MNNQTKNNILQIDSRLELVAEVATAISNYCQALKLDKQICFQIELCAVEAINNAIIHAYQNQPDHQVDIEWWFDSPCLFIKISDSGLRMQKMPEDKLVPPDAESGRGWFIMRQWMDEVAYTSDGNCNSLVLQKLI